MFYITGDTHGNAAKDATKLSRKKMKQKGLPFPTSGDQVIICGDWGFPFYPTAEARDKYKETGEYRYWMKWFSQYPCEIYFVDGNHDSHPFWNAQPVIERFGGRMHAHPEAPNVFHMMRGEVYDIDGYKFFCFGGAASHDTMYRTEGVDWWPEEQASETDFQNAMKNLAKCDFSVDYVITHTMPMTAIDEEMYERTPDRTADYLSIFYNNNQGKNGQGGIDFKHWFCGHFHKDGEIADGITVCYKEFQLVGEGV